MFGPCGGPPLKGPGGACGVLSHNGIVWFNNYNLYNFRCPRVTQLSSPALKGPAHKGPPPPGPRRGCGGGDEDTLFLAISSCHNITFLHVVRQCNCLVWCCHTMELFGLAHKGPPPPGPRRGCGVLSYNVIVWFDVVTQWNCLVW